MAQTASNNCGYNVGNQYAVTVSCTAQTFNKPNGNTNFMNPGTCGGNGNNDAWGWFSATATTTTVRYTPNAGNRNPILHIFTGACGALAQVACVNAFGNGVAEEITLATTIGTNYMVRLQHAGGNNTMDGNLCVFNTPPPANDEPCDAVVLNVGAACGTPLNTNNSGATHNPGIPAPGCGNYAGGDVWYAITAPLNGTVTVRTAAGSLTNSAVAIYSADACNGTFDQLGCSEDGNGAMGQLTQNGLVPGRTYYVRVWGESGAQGTFTICVWSPLTNNTPCTAAELPLDSDCAMAMGHNVGATATTGIPAPGCAGYTGADVWYRFTAPDDPKVTIRSTAGGLNNIGMALYSATACDGTFTLMACDNLNGPGNMPFLTFSEIELTTGQTYYLRVWRNGSNTGGTFNICAFTAPTGSDCVYVLRMLDRQGDGWGASNLSIQVGAGPAQTYTLTNADRDVAYIPVNIGDLVQVTYNAIGGGQVEIAYLIQLGIGLLFSDGPTPTNGLVYADFADCLRPPTAQSDCVGSHTICDAQTVAANPSNTGLTEDLNVSNRGCLLNDERQGIWFNFTPSAGGTLAFTLAPNNPSDDYDFAVYGPSGTLTCPPSAPIRCNYSGTTGNTGLSTASANASQGASGSPWSSALPVAVGEVYLLYVSNWSRSGLSFELTWQLTDGASLDCTVLPVDLLTFEGETANDGAHLRWTTASERNSAYFIVERASADGLFAPIGSVPAAGDSQWAIDYRFHDPDPVPGLNYYRLRPMDSDGQGTWTHAVPLTFRRTVGYGLPYPNPASEMVFLDLMAEEEAEVDILVLDASGRLLRTSTARLSPGTHVHQTLLNGLSAGIYALVVRTPDGETQHAGRFVVR